MMLEPAILIFTPMIAILSIIFVPAAKRFQAQFVLLFVQLPTWLLGLCAVQMHLLEYPYREFSKVNRTSFIFEYLVLPILCIHFNAHFPNRATRLKKLGFYAGISLTLTGVEFLLERYTALIKYTGWQWYWTFLSVCLILWLSRITTLWFFKA